MVAKIKTPTSIVRALNYNEQKVQKGVAECIYADNLLRDVNDLNFYQKQKRFNTLISLNEAKTNSLHISLNFDLSDRLSKDKLVEIASHYMERIGFSDQPYLVYQHHDAAHPHLHIVTTSIKNDGSRIDTFNIGRNQSEKARKEIELEFNLVIASGKNKLASQQIKPVNIQKVIYGKSETKRAITNVLDAVLNTYKYTSIAELNAVLKQYNVVADRGKEVSTTFKKGGIVYRILDEKGSKVGIPIKASSIYSTPTLTHLEEKFNANEVKRKPDLKRVKTSIDWILVKPPRTLNDFIKLLEREKIATVVRQNEDGLVYGLTYIDHQTKAVFNGSDIGKEYSAKGIMNRCGILQSFQSAIKERYSEKSDQEAADKHVSPANPFVQGASKVFGALLKSSTQNDQMPFELNQNQKPKKKKQRSHS
ncbi:relaxase/mobilization nuclease domain-containing protein [Segetibacter koreensis]|uniref:relaxase/mobilization nuclease domain-containing protein n=1 Tax=Segetibacter koreensis TaxID=398037 RepID=UPI00035DA900|nr:relaxase/mobilization nuclease domain-containing protein [Segetibacter koreensis]